MLEEEEDQKRDMTRQLSSLGETLAADVMTEENLLDDDNFQGLDSTPSLLNNVSEVFERLTGTSGNLNTKQSRLSTKKSMKRNSRLDSLDDEDEMEDDEILDGSELNEDDFYNENLSQHSQHDDRDNFYAIEEEEEDDEEDSFEKELKTKKEKIQLDYETKMDEMEKRYAGSLFDSLPTRDNRTCVTQA